MQMWCVWICMQSTDVIPIMQGWMSYPSFSCKAEDMKSTVAWTRMKSFSFLLVLPVCGYLCLFNICKYSSNIKKSQQQQLSALRTLQSRLRSWFCSSAPSSVYLPWLSALQHCCASRCSFSDANSYHFRFWRRYSFAPGLPKVSRDN